MLHTNKSNVPNRTIGMQLSTFLSIRFEYFWVIVWTFSECQFFAKKLKQWHSPRRTHLSSDWLAPCILGLSSNHDSLLGLSSCACRIVWPPVPTDLFFHCLFVLIALYRHDGGWFGYWEQIVFWSLSYYILNYHIWTTCDCCWENRCELFVGKTPVFSRALNSLTSLKLCCTFWTSKATPTPSSLIPRQQNQY